jgi:hypothetical protein
MNAGSCSQGAAGLCGPRAVGLDRAGHLLVADTGNNRVLEYDDPLNDPATRVFGQANFTDNLCNAGGSSPTGATLCQPAGVATSGAYEGTVFVADTGNNRILSYEAPYCIETFSLTAANRKTKGIRSKPEKTKLNIQPGTGGSGDTVQFSDHLVQLENDGMIDESYAPLFTLSTDSAFSSGIVFDERVPGWVDNIRATRTGGIWGTGDLTEFGLTRGISFYKLTDSFFIPAGFSDAPQRNRISYTAKAIGMDLSGFTASHAWFRGQFGSTCFTTEFRCVLQKSGKRVCSPAKPVK